MGWEFFVPAGTLIAAKLLTLVGVQGIYVHKIDPNFYTTNYLEVPR